MRPSFIPRSTLLSWWTLTHLPRDARQAPPRASRSQQHYRGSVPHTDLHNDPAIHDSSIHNRAFCTLRFLHKNCLLLCDIAWDHSKHLKGVSGKQSGHCMYSGCTLCSSAESRLCRHSAYRMSSTASSPQCFAPRWPRFKWWTLARLGAAAALIVHQSFVFRPYFASDATSGWHQAQLSTGAPPANPGKWFTKVIRAN